VIEVWNVFRDDATSGYQYESPEFLAPLEEEVAKAKAQVDAAESEDDEQSARESLRIAEERLGMFKRQAKEAESAYARREAQLKHFFRSNQADIDAYLRDLAWLESMKTDASAAETPFQQERIASKEAEVRAKAQTLMGGLQQLNESYERDLYNLATPQQRQSGMIHISKADAAWIDATVKWMVLLVGACLILGLFTRPAAVVGALFLCSVLAAAGWPFWSGESEEPLKVLVELFALLVLAAVGAGRFAGLDFFWYALKARIVGDRRAVVGEQA
jgi:uncharacterized membrane protein YphA (DoxX/SURF4 family)